MSGPLARDVPVLDRMAENQAHLWCCELNDIVDPAVLQACRDLLTEEEQARADRCHFAKDRKIALVSRAMLRSLLARYADVAPRGWRFRSNRHGRPEILAPEHVKDLHFNLSHTDGMVVVLISKERRLGVDVESVNYRGRCLDIAERFFCRSECAVLRALPAEEIPARFIAYWTLKEAFVKACGIGLSLPLNSSAFSIGSGPERPIACRFSPDLAEKAEQWQFELRNCGHFVVATAIEKGGGEPLEVARRQWDPAMLSDHATGAQEGAEPR